MNQEKIKSLCVTAIFTAVICVIAPFSITVGSLVPLSLATFAIYLTASMLDFKNAVSAVLVYILLGAVGLPVFSSFSGGLQKLAGVTGGYIIGYIPLVILIALLLKFKRKVWMYPLSMVLGTAVLYAFGTAWFIVQTKTTLASALASCVVPFLIGDAVKIICASAIATATRKRLNKFLTSSN